MNKIDKILFTILVTSLAISVEPMFHPLVVLSLITIVVLVLRIIWFK